MKEQKAGLTAMNWFLSILGIIILICLIILPPVFRTIFKEKPTTENLETEIIIKKLTCKKDRIITDNYTDSEELTFNYFNDHIRTYSKETNRIYNEYTIYSEDKQLFGRYVSAFSILSGYKYSIVPTDNDMSIKISEYYDLGSFNETTITIPGDTTETSITSTYSKDDSMSQIQANLVNSGYICE